VAETIKKLKQQGISLKVISGDNRLVTEHIGEQVGLSTSRIITGSDLLHISDAALVQQANQVSLFRGNRAQPEAAHYYCPEKSRQRGWLYW
jgi:Mg2+-importing ATPase